VFAIPLIPVPNMQSLWMLLACVMFAIMGACVKVAGESGVSLAQVILFRGLPSVVLLFIWTRMTHRSLRPKQWMPHVFRNLTGIWSVWMCFFVLTSLLMSAAYRLRCNSVLFIAIWMQSWEGEMGEFVHITSFVMDFMELLTILPPCVEDDQWIPGA